MSKRNAEPSDALDPQKRPRVDDTGAEVAADFAASLLDLITNDRYSISTLTVVAQENTEYAQTISDVLRKHIRSVPPTRKLPALYVLDSIVKNVGTPYTLFLSQDLFQTFFDAYTVVDDATRKQMENMLKTWREPTPGSLDGRPVFPIEATRRIETALIKARTAFIEQQKSQIPLHRPAVHSLPPRPPSMVNSPLPFMQSEQASTTYNQNQQIQNPQYLQRNGTPVADFRYGLPPPQNVPEYQNHYQSTSSSVYGQQQAQISSPQPMYQNAYQPPPHSAHYEQQNYLYPQTAQPQYQTMSSFPQNTSAYLPPPTPTVSTEMNPAPTADLSSILSQLSRQIPGLAGAAVPQQHNQHASPSYASPPPVNPQQSQLPSTAQLPASLTDLAEILKMVQKTSGNTPTQSLPGFAPPPFPPQPFSGLANTPALTTVNPQNNFYSTTSSLPTTLPNLNAGLVATNPENEVKLTLSSLKIPRPNLLVKLYPPANQSSQCATCGRRFSNTPESRARKTRHLDAHFRTNMRLSSSQDGKGQSSVVQRSWYLDEGEWISYREVDDADEPAQDQKIGLGGIRTGAVVEDHNTNLAFDANGQQGMASSMASNRPQEKFIPAPTDPILKKAPCPICQEEFETVWSDSVQEWVWLDAVEVVGKNDGGKKRVFHGTCLEMLAGDSRELISKKR